MLKQRSYRLVSFAALLVPLSMAFVSVTASAQIARDDTPGQTPGPVPEDNGFFVIDGRSGIKNSDGTFVLHSMRDFNLQEGETAFYTDDVNSLGSVRDVLTRVTGGQRSTLDGLIDSNYDSANLLFVNPNGVFFGPNFQIDVQGSFHVSTADFLEVEELASGAISQISTEAGTSQALPLFTAATPFAWGFLSAGPEKTIVVDGLDATGSFSNSSVDAFTFTAANIQLATGQGAGDIKTNGRDLIAVALGQVGRVENFAARDPNGNFVEPEITDLNGGSNITFAGQILSRANIDTTGDDSDSGGVFFQSGEVNLVTGSISTAATLDSAVAGDVRMVGFDVIVGADIDTSSQFQGSGNEGAGDVEIGGFSSLEFVGTRNINARGGSPGTPAGNVSLFGGSLLDANNLSIFVSDSSTNNTSSEVALFGGNTLNFREGLIQASTGDNGSPGTVLILGGNVDIRDTLIDMQSDGSLFGTPEVAVTAFDELDARGSTINLGAFGGADGGDLILQTASTLEDATTNFNISAFGGGTDGTITRIQLDPPPGNDPPGPSDPGDSLLVTDPLQNLFSGAPEIDDDFTAFDDPLGSGGLTPMQPGTFLAALGGGVSGGSGGSEGESDVDSEDKELTAAAEAQVMLVGASTEAEAQKKNAAIPGVSLFSNASQRSPIVPRTCNTLARGEERSKLLARTNKRMPASPEDWLIAFDTTGDRLLAAAQNPDLPPVAAIEGAGANLEEVRRNARTQRALAEAAVAVRGGRYEEASAGFEQAVAELEASGDARGASEALLAYAQLQLEDGRFGAARQSLERALALAEPLDDEVHTASIRASLGNALIGTGDLARAEDELTRGLNVVMKSKSDAPAPSVLNNLGNRHAATRDFKSARWAYGRSAELARKLGNKGDEARALSGAARASADSNRLTEARKLLDRAMGLMAAIDAPDERIPLAIHMGRTYAQLASVSPRGRSASLLSAFDAYDMALKSAEESGNLRGVALANLNLGALYQEEQHRSEALYLTRLARRAAESLEAPEILYRAHWQEGQILWADHQVNASLAAHRRAVAILEETKPVPSDGYGSSDANFRMAVGGVYQDTVDRLLRAAGLTTEPRRAERLIVEARDILERLKAAELRDYFEDECIASIDGEGRGIDALGDDVAVVYTVSLPDRLEMLVGLPTGVERFSTPVSALRLNKTIDRFRLAVQNPLTTTHRALGRKLYDWTVGPYASRLDEAGIETLVVIPDGRLRTLPFAALADGNQYLGERFAIATALSLRLLTPPSVASEPGRPVLAGVSESVQGFSALEAVSGELAEIQALEGGEVFLNQAFTLDEVRGAVAREVPRVVHLATHAVFTGNPDTSFLLTYGGRVGFDDLSDVVGMTQADGAPLDLLVLSACETAVGNDRAGLGFTGSAIRAGARSALGSLWPISDAAAGQLMIDFYRGLQTHELSKAEALRAAQAKLRTSERFNHPFYWAPFTLVNDWM